jgi:hypothetical protein
MSGPAARRIFVSSTCHDLVDVRAEVKAQLEDEGYLVSMSDVPETFTLDGTADSIETCLVNLRASDVVVLILSQRYGAPLTPLNVQKSATHVEYDEAIKYQKPILVYVRDRLMAVYDQWSASGKQAVPKNFWSKDKDAEALVRLIDEHKALGSSKSVTNWLSIFANSVELKKQLRQHLGQNSGRLLLEKLHRERRLPWLSLSVALPPDGPPSGCIQNKQRVTIQGVAVKVQSGRTQQFGDIAPGAVVRFDGVAVRDVAVAVEWYAPECGKVRDTFAIDPNGYCTLSARQLVEPSSITLLGPDDA